MPKVKTPLMQKFARRPKQERVPLWEGPESNGPQGGITQSLLSRFLVCRERFRIHVIEGLRPTETWNQRLGYGEMWHICEEALATYPYAKTSDYRVWELNLEEHVKEQCKKYPLQQEQIVHWYNVCKTQFPVYVQYWAKHPDVVNRTPLLQERSFNVPYRLPSGRVVYLRGKWDSVDLVKRGRKSSIVLKENKTKGDIDEVQLQNQLTFDLQTMLYLVALEEYQNCQMRVKNSDFWRDNQHLYPKDVDAPISGINYNVVRRPLSGGVGSIVQGKGSKGAKCTLKSCRDVPSRDCPKCKGTGRVGAKPPETDENFYRRLRGIIDGTTEGSPGPSYFFMRWDVAITPHDIEKFKTQFLNPCLEDLCGWYERVANAYMAEDDPFLVGGGRHYRTPFGIYNVLAEGGATDLDAYLETGDSVGLTKAETLFRELE